MYCYTNRNQFSSPCWKTKLSLRTRLKIEIVLISSFILLLVTHFTENLSNYSFSAVTSRQQSISLFSTLHLKLLQQVLFPARSFVALWLWQSSSLSSEYSSALSSVSTTDIIAFFSSSNWQGFKHFVLSPKSSRMYF